MNNKPEIAIIESNTLTCLGLKSILEEIIPMATIRTFHSFSELIDDTPDMYAHYFISAQIYVEHNAFFLRMMDFFFTSRHFFFAAAIDDGDFFGPQTQCTAGSIHRNIAAAYNCDLVANTDGVSTSGYL